MQGITFRTSDKSVNAYNFREGKRAVTEPVDVLRYTWEKRSGKDHSLIETHHTRCKDLLQSSMPKEHDRIQNFVPRSNGFVDTILEAYNQHHNLIIRPDDIWVAILSQLSLYVNANSEELRKVFVQHKGKMKLELVYVGERRTFDFSIMARDFSKLLKKNINDPSFGDFVLPNFSTTGPNDTVICSMIMMSILKQYFEFSVVLSCGIPEITLLGTKEDYLNILQRIDQLSQMEMGAEPRAFAALLRPIITKFISAFDEAPQIDKEFWGRICHHIRVFSGSDQLSGWVTAFCVWNEQGRWCGPDLNTLKYDHASEDRFEIDGKHYPVIPITRIPPGWCEADVHLNDNGEELECVVVAGHMVTEVMETSGSNIMGTIRPAPQWFMFEKRVWWKNKRLKSGWNRFLRRVHLLRSDSFFNCLLSASVEENMYNA
ncbi:hypothetical protein M422DRAFT_213960 [Sphaerobolus stellatus SS14]|uniref:Uncharacterized protein n=1 Tax=Sphaerobolus stellatus (strain SS14) TaxID=990650 RepID=A0A0C9V4F2_SPHS4|nr:hypothetical protein M422DRAFT_213960 [Sphaerobolus stellatus SS14]